MGDCMVSRWMKRSKEEKERILRETREREARGKKHVGKLFVLSMAGIEKEESYLKDGKLPIRCDKCGIVTSDSYVIVKRKFMFSGSDETYVEGTCNRCGGKAGMWIIPSFNNATKIMLYTAVIMKLLREGKVVDKR